MRPNAMRAVIGLLAFLFVAAAAIVAYNMGVAQGLAQSGAAAGATAPYPYGWPRPWGIGFLFPLLFFAFWMLLFRGLCWRQWGPWYYEGPRGERFEEWHRRAHDRMAGKE